MSEVVVTIDGAPRTLGPGDRVVVGRASGDDVVGLDPDDRGISRSAFAVESVDGHWQVVNLSESQPLYLETSNTSSRSVLAPGTRTAITDTGIHVVVEGLASTHRIGISPVPQSAAEARHADEPAPAPPAPAGHEAEAPQVTCPSCGSTLPGDSRFCTECGQPVAPAPVEAVAPPTPTPAGAPPRAASAPDADPAPPPPEAAPPAPPAPPGHAPRRSRLGGRRAWYGVALAVLVALATTVVTTRESGSSGAWTVGPFGTRVDLSRVPSGDPQERWSASIGGSTVADLAVSGGIIAAVVVDDGEAEVVGFDRRDGKRRWQATLADEGFHDLVALDGIVVAATTNWEDERSTLLGLAADDGRELWSSDSRTTGVNVAPIGDGLFMARDSDSEPRVRVVAARDGKELWSARASATVVAGSAVAIAHDGEVELRSLRSGERRWSRQVADNDDWLHLAPFGDLVVAATGEEIVGLAMSDGAERWTADPGIGTVYSLQAVDDTTFVASGEDGMAALDGDRRRRWSSSSTLYVSVRQDGKTLGVVVDSDGQEIEVLDLRNGRTLGNYAFDDDQWVFSESEIDDDIVVANAVLVRGSDASVSAVGLDPVDELWTVDLPGDYLGGVWAADDSLVVVDDDGSMRLFT